MYTCLYIYKGFLCILSFIHYHYLIMYCRRIIFCLELHNDAVKSMRYPPSDDLQKKQLLLDKDASKDKDKKSNNDEKSIEDIIKEMEEEDDSL